VGIRRREAEEAGVTISRESDADLVARARSGSREAFDELVERHRDALYGFAVRWTRDPDRAVDVVQETFVRAYTNLARYRGEGAFRTWCFAIAVNLLRSAARRGARESVGLEAAAGVPDGNPGPDRAVSDAEEMERVVRWLGGLPPKQRAAVMLRVYGGLSFREIGEVLGCREGAARVNYHHGIEKLREMLS
jgi:RNA polymerase sigma factor (sigma-70 family)